MFRPTIVSAIGVAVLAISLTTTWAAVSPTPKIVVCYYSNWAQYTPGIGKFLPSDLAPGLCSHVMFAFTIVNAQNQMTYGQPEDAGTVDKIVKVSKAAGTKVFLSVGGGAYPSSQFSQLASSKSARASFILSTITLLRKHVLHGLDVDWENPGANGGRPVDKANYVTLLRELRMAFVAEAKHTGKLRLLLSAALAVGSDVISQSYDVKGVNANLDLLNIMTYDYAGPSFTTVTGNLAPLVNADPMSGYSVEVNIKQWIAAGASPSKMTLGIPAYAVTWTLANASNSGVGAATIGAGNAGPYTAFKGTLSFYEVEAILASGGKYHYDAASQSFYVVKGNQWISTEKPGLPPSVTRKADPPIGSLARKARFIQQQGLAGAMFWQLSQDSFQNHKYPIINTVRSMLRSGGSRVG